MSVKTELILQDKMSSVIRDINRNLGNTVKAMDDVEKAGSSAFGGKLKTAAKAVGVAAAAGAAAVGAAAVKIGKEALNAYADFQQLEGGVETLFKGSAESVMKNASNAFKTAGLSANQYMETVTSFSASLIKSVGGDTVKAAKMADMAITDMSDNANKMGSDMASIQNAYQGFAKQNYTMLDNLKLGYGGTKEEMQRLLEDAEKLSGVKYDISSYADIVDAIHVVQTEMGITGTTAEEASKTISGSLNMLKGSWQNLLTGLGDPSADIGKLANDVISSLTTVALNILPTISTVFDALPGMVDKLGDGLLSAVDKLAPSLGKLVNGLLASILKLLPKVAKTGVKLVASLASSIGQQLPQLIPIATEAIVTVVTELLGNLDLILDAGLQLIVGLGQGLIAALPILVDSLPVIVDNLIEFFLAATPALMQAGFELLTALLDNLPGIIGNIVSKLPQIIQKVLNYWVSQISNMASTGFQLFIALIQRIGEVISRCVSAVKELGSRILSAIRERISEMVNVGYNLLVGLWNGIKKAKDWVIGKIQGIGSSILGALRGIFKEHSPSKETDLIGVNLMKGLGGGITRSAGEALNAAKAVSSDVLNSFGDMNATAKIGAEYTGTTGSAFTVGGGKYTNNVNVVVNVDMSGMQNSIANGNDMDDMVTRLVNGIRMKTATAMQGVV